MPVAPSSRGAVSSVDDVKSATIQIEAEGTLLEPGGGLCSTPPAAALASSSTPGIAVTNNHVVTGAALLKV